VPEFNLPDLGEGVTEGEVVEWRVSEGETVARDQVLVVVGTDKATVEIPSPYEGVVDAILVKAGATVEVGQPLIRVKGAKDEPPPSASPPVPAPSDLPAAQPAAPARRVPALPSVRRLARDRGISLDEISGSGPQGRVRMADLPSSGRRVPLRGPQRVMAQRMALAHRHVPQVTVVLECDFTQVEGFLEAPRGDRQVAHTILGLVALATVAGLRESPIFDCSFDEDRMELVYPESTNLGIAVQTKEGLKVATIRDAGRRDPSQLQRELDRLIAAARDGSLPPADLTGSTFTISSGGKLGGLMATTLVNWPNVATLGLHQIEARPVVRAGSVVVGRCANLSLSFDHRVIDGMTASAFLYELRQRLSRPEDLVGAGS
jgi:pyruvate/2-oxoglutarate dehydrogenase complex dihydrolipoamide acyltransferase (E2) component